MSDSTKKDVFGNTVKHPKREQREQYSGDQQRDLAAALGPKPVKNTLLARFKKSQNKDGGNKGQK
jgi:hypothetical protein